MSLLVKNEVALPHARHTMSVVKQRSVRPSVRVCFLPFFHLLAGHPKHIFVDFSIKIAKGGKGRRRRRRRAQ